MPVSRLRLRDLMISRLPEVIGACATDTPSIARAVNSAQRRLLMCREAGDTGWYGGYAEMVFNIDSADPYLTLPRGVARLISVDACDYPVPIRNQFYEYLAFGDGHLPKTNCTDSSQVCFCGVPQVLRRNVTPTYSELAPPRKGLRIYPGDLGDAGGTNRVFVGGLDNNDQALNSIDSTVQVNGIYTSIETPFADVKIPLTSSAIEISLITTILKDVTLAPVRIYEVDLDTGAQRLLLTMDPSEQNAVYSRYYFHRLPSGCCPVPGAAAGVVQVKAMVKLDLIPATVDSDALLIQSEEAIIAECQAARFADMDSVSAKQMAAERHREAVRYLQGQLVHFEGKESPSIEFAPWGSAHLEKQKIGRLM